MSLHSKRSRTRTGLTVCLIAVIYGWLGPQAMAAAAEARPETTRVEPYASHHSIARRVLAFPSRLWHAVWSPLGEVMIWEERTAFHKRAMDFLLNDDRTGGFIPMISLGGATGAGLGGKFFHNNLFGQGKKASLAGIFSGTQNYFVDAGLFDPSPAALPFSVGLTMNYIKDSEEDFFPGGFESRLADERNYAFDQMRLDAQLSAHATRFAAIAVTAGWRRTNVRKTSRRLPALPDDTPGLGRYALFEVGAAARLGWKNPPAYPTQGFEVLAAVSHAKQTDGPLYGYTRFTGELRTYVPLYRGNRILALRVQLQRVRPDAGRRVPFMEQPVLGTSLSLRGYERNRFRDTGSLLVNLEYRYPVWDTWSAVFFFDQGQVFNRASELRLNRFKRAFGTGIHFRSRLGFIARLEVGVSSERVRPLLQFEQLF